MFFLIFSKKKFKIFIVPCRKHPADGVPDVERVQEVGELQGGAVERGEGEVQGEEEGLPGNQEEGCQEPGGNPQLHLPRSVEHGGYVGVLIKKIIIQVYRNNLKIWRVREVRMCLKISLY